jgi:hypothetical protein
MTRWKRSKTKPFWPRERPQAAGLRRQLASWLQIAGRRQRSRKDGHARPNWVWEKRSPGKVPALEAAGKRSPIAETVANSRTSQDATDGEMLLFNRLFSESRGNR